MKGYFNSFWTELLPFRQYLVELSIGFVLCFLLYSLLKEKFSKRLPPGPIGLPFVGSLPFIGKRPQLTAIKYVKKYGNLFSLRLGRQLVIVINDYETMKEILSHPMALDAVPQILRFFPKLGFLSKSGEEWEEQRRFCVHSMRDLGLGRGPWEKKIQEEIPAFLKQISTFEGRPVDIEPLLHRTLCRNILSLLMGKKLVEGKDDEELELITQFTDSIVTCSLLVAVSSFIPGLSKLLKAFNIGGIGDATDVINNFTRIITKDAIERHKGEEFAGVKDFINIYLEKMQAKNASNEKHYFSEQNAEGNLHALFFGGSDTVLAYLEWLFRLTAGHPDIQKRVQKELDNVIGKEETISFEDRTKIPYTFSVLMETQRFASIAPLSIPRSAREDFEVRGYTIPKSSMIVTNIAAIHRDPKYWKESEKFQPERFQSEDGTKILANLPSFVPFSIGKRNCPGEKVAWMEILIYYTSVMQKFSIQIPAGDAISYEYGTGALSHLYPQKLCFVTRN